MQGELWGDAVEQKERRKAPPHWTSLLLALVDLSTTVSQNGLAWPRVSLEFLDTTAGC